MPNREASRVFTLERIQKLAGVRAFARATAIRKEDIEEASERDGQLTAIVRGTLPYSVVLWSDDRGKPAYSCTCPQGDEGRFCKHAAAVALTLHGGGREALRSDRQPRDPVNTDEDPVFEFLLGLDHRELAQLVFDAAQRDRRTAQRIEAKAAASVSASAVDAKEWRKAITAVFGRPSRFIDYHAAPGWADGVHEVLDELRGLLDDGEADSVIPLVEYAFERADRAVGYVDSSDGCFGGISWEIADLHLAACTAERPDPVALARRLAQFDLRAELDTFRRAAQTYAQLLGPEGLAEYRLLVQPAFDALGPQTEHDYSADRLHLTEAMLAIARAEGDVDEVIAIRAADLRSPHHYEEIIEVLADAGRTTEAIEWAREGLSTPGREFQKHKLRDQIAALLMSVGDAPGAVDVRGEAFRTAPSLPGYRDLLTQARSINDAVAEHERAAALELLRERAAHDGSASGSTLVEILLYEGAIDFAWDAARTYGCDQRWWMTLARAREGDHPADAIPVYERHVEASIETKKNNGYTEAVKLMVRIHRLHAATGDDGWEPFLEGVLTRHRQKRNLMAKLTDAGWT